MTIAELIVELQNLPEKYHNYQVTAHSMFGPFLVAEGETASSLVDLNFGLEAKDSEEAVCLSPLCFKVTGFVDPQGFDDRGEIVLELTFEHD